MVYIAFKALRFQAPTGGGSGMNSPWMLGTIAFNQKWQICFGGADTPPPFSQKILLINKDIVSLTLDASLKFSAIQSKTVTAHKPGPALYFETPLPSLCCVLERGDGSSGTKVKITHRETVLPHPSNSRELKWGAVIANWKYYLCISENWV